MDWVTHQRRILVRLGEDATYTPSGGGGSSTVRVMYQQPFQNVLGMESSDPMLGCIGADVPNLAHGDTFVVRGVTYTVKRVEPNPVSGLSLAALEQ